MKTNIKYLLLINIVVLAAIGVYLFGITVPAVPALTNTVSYIFWGLVNNWGIVVLTITNLIALGLFLLYISSVYEETKNKSIKAEKRNKKLLKYLESANIKNSTLKKSLVIIFGNNDNILYSNVFHSFLKLTDRGLTEMGVRDIVQNIELYPNNEEFVSLLSELTSYNDNELRAFTVYHKIQDTLTSSGKMGRMKDLQTRTVAMVSDINSKKKEMALSALMSIEEEI